MFSPFSLRFSTTVVSDRPACLLYSQLICNLLVLLLMYWGHPRSRPVMFWGNSEVFMFATKVSNTDTVTYINFCKESVIPLSTSTSVNDNNDDSCDQSKRVHSKVGTKTNTKTLVNNLNLANTLNEFYCHFRRHGTELTPLPQAIDQQPPALDHSHSFTPPALPPTQLFQFCSLNWMCLSPCAEGSHTSWQTDNISWEVCLPDFIVLPFVNSVGYLNLCSTFLPCYVK